MRLSLEQAVERYGKIENGTWADETKWCVLVQVPDEISAHWINTVTGRPTTHLYINRDMAPALEKTFEAITTQGLTSCLKTFDGCFCIRDVRAEPGKPSCHSYALAIDINASTNKLGMVGDLDPRLAKCFTDNGFAWGATFPRKDSMHLSYAWET